MAVTGLAPPAYYIATSALKSSVVLQAVQGSFQKPGSQDVVFGKVPSLAPTSLTHPLDPCSPPFDTVLDWQRGRW